MQYQNTFVGELPIPANASKWLLDAIATAANMPTADVLRDAQALVGLLLQRQNQAASD